MKRDPDTYIPSFQSADRLGTLLGARFISISQQECIYEYDAKAEHCNPNGILHGGALYSVMDSSQGALVHFILEDTYVAAATGTATIRYLAPIRSGTLRIRTWLKGRERRKLYVNSTATNDAGVTVAELEEVWVALHQPHRINR